MPGLLDLLRGQDRPKKGELLFADDFARPDGPSPGSGWFDKDRTCRLERKALAIQVGWVGLSRSFPGPIRLEFNAAYEKSASFGAFLSGAEGFWNGYSLVVADGHLALRRLDVLVATTLRAPLRARKTYRFFLERTGRGFRAGINGRPLLEALDLDPLPGEEHARAGLFSFRSKMRFESVAVYAAPAPPENPALAAAEALVRGGKPAAALEELRRAEKKLVPEARLIARLQAGRCLSFLGKNSDALKTYEPLLNRGPSHVSSLASKYFFEAALWGESWAPLRETLRRLETDPRHPSPARKAVVASLARLDKVWEHKKVWGEGRGAEVLDSLMKVPDYWENGWAVRVLLKFAWVALGPGDFSGLLSRLSKAKPEIIESAEARWGAHFLRAEDLAFQGRLPEARKLWDTLAASSPRGPLAEHQFAFAPSFVLAEGLLGGIPKAGEKIVQSPAAALRVAEAAWGLAREDKATALLEAVLARPDAPGYIAAQAVLDLAALRLAGGDAQASVSAAGHLRGPWAQEIWAQPLVDILAGKSHASAWSSHLSWDIYWTQGPARIMPLLALAGHAAVRNKTALARHILVWIRGISFPWEPSRAVADRWLYRLEAKG